MALTPAEVDFVEHMAKERFRYESTFAEQAEVLRTDPAKTKEAKAKFLASGLIGERGKWQPTQDKADEYLAKCDDICRMVPRDFDDRVKILYAAHAGLMCLVNCKFAQQRERVQLAFVKRHHEISESMYPTPALTNNSEPPISKPLKDPRRISAEDLQLFQIPDNLHGKKFLLSPDSDESGMYEVIGYARKRDKTVTYDVLFDDCEDPVSVTAKEMMGMLEDSLYFPN
ncbi:hypothetical protein EI94DRAFT_1826456 [Lactarius quietus]|nr:hypothetical protein EI94DRAFT_1826456 [Lactarius quietus]